MPLYNHMLVSSIAGLNKLAGIDKFRKVDGVHSLLFYTPHMQSGPALHLWHHQSCNATTLWANGVLNTKLYELIAEDRPEWLPFDLIPPSTGWPEHYPELLAFVSQYLPAKFKVYGRMRYGGDEWKSIRRPHIPEELLGKSRVRKEAEQNLQARKPIAEIACEIELA